MRPAGLVVQVTRAGTGPSLAIRCAVPRGMSNASPSPVGADLAAGLDPQGPGEDLEVLVLVRVPVRGRALAAGRVGRLDDEAVGVDGDDLHRRRPGASRSLLVGYGGRDGSAGLPPQLRSHLEIKILDLKLNCLR